MILRGEITRTTRNPLRIGAAADNHNHNNKQTNKQTNTFKNIKFDHSVGMVLYRAVPSNSNMLQKQKQELERSYLKKIFLILFFENDEKRYKRDSCTMLYAETNSFQDNGRSLAKNSMWMIRCGMNHISNAWINRCAVVRFSNRGRKQGQNIYHRCRND